MIQVWAAGFISHIPPVPLNWDVRNQRNDGILLLGHEPKYYTTQNSNNSSIYRVHTHTRAHQSTLVIHIYKGSAQLAELNDSTFVPRERIIYEDTQQQQRESSLYTSTCTPLSPSLPKPNHAIHSTAYIYICPAGVVCHNNKPVQ